MLQLPIPDVIASIMCTTGAHALAVFHKHHLSVASCQRDQVYMKILLDVRMQPATIALNYSVKNIRNDVQRMIHTYMHI